MKAIVTAAMVALMAGPGAAAVVTIGTDEGLVSPGRDNQGWWREGSQNSNPTNDNYYTGASDSYRSYFTFDLSGLTGQTITALSLDLRRYNQSGTVELDFWDVDTSAADLAQREVINGTIFADLGSGLSYGSSGPIGVGASTDVLSFTLGAQAVVDANAAIGGYFSIGVSSLSSSVIFASSGAEPGNGGPGYTQNLVVTTGEAPAAVPLPASLPLLALTLGGLGFAARRRATASRL